MTSPPSLAPDSPADLVERYTRPALSLARRIIVDERLAEDVVQEAFLAYWRNPAAFDRSRNSFSAWFLSVVHHKAVDAVRRETSLRRRADAVAEVTLHDTARDVADMVADRVAQGVVRTALEALPPKQREALVLAYWGGYTQQEIARRTGTPLGTVKTRMLAGMRRLHAGLQPAEAATARVSAVPV